MTQYEYYATIEELWAAILAQGATHVAYHPGSEMMVLSHNSLVMQEIHWPHTPGHEVAVEMTNLASKVHRSYYAMMTRLMK